LRFGPVQMRVVMTVFMWHRHDASVRQIAVGALKLNRGVMNVMTAGSIRRSSSSMALLADGGISAM